MVLILGFGFGSFRGNFNFNLVVLLKFQIQFVLIMGAEDGGFSTLEFVLSNNESF